MSTERNTKFQGFAKLLYEELATLPYIPLEGKGYSERMKQIIARRAYDLAVHVISNLSTYEYEVLSPTEAVAMTPDLTEWPKET
jgi:hypothetical protein